jgi:hypothetical protein
MSKKVTVSGDTKSRREGLKKRKFQWSPTQQHWWLWLSDTHSGYLLDEATRDEYLDRLDYRLRGCQVAVDGVVVYTSPSYADLPAVPAYHSAAAEGSDNRDAYGNYVPARRVTGSSPDDLV